MKVAQKIKHAKIHMQKFIQNPFPPLNPPTKQTHKPKKIIKSTWKKQTQKFKINKQQPETTKTNQISSAPLFTLIHFSFLSLDHSPKSNLSISLSLSKPNLSLFLSLCGETQIPNRSVNAASKQQIDDDEHQARKNRRRLRRIGDAVEQSLGQ